MKFELSYPNFLETDECTLGSHNCGINAECTNTNGSFSCACNAGYSGNGVTCNGRLNVDVIICFCCFLYL